MKRFTRSVAIALWPSFMMAGVLEIAVFAFVDPESVHSLGGGPTGLSATAVYSLAFLAFWVLVGVACMMALKLACGADEVNARATVEDI